MALPQTDFNPFVGRTKPQTRKKADPIVINREPMKDPSVVVPMDHEIPLYGLHETILAGGEFTTIAQLAKEGDIGIKTTRHPELNRVRYWAVYLPGRGQGWLLHDFDYERLEDYLHGEELPYYERVSTRTL